MSTLASKMQTLRRPLYDARTIPATGGALKTSFFGNTTQQALGYLTNTQGGVLPQPESFELYSPRIVPALATALALQQAVVSSFVELIFNSREFWQGPGWLLPSGAGLVASGSGAAATEQVTHGLADPNACWQFGDASLEFVAQQQFRASFDYSSPAALPGTAVLTHLVYDGLHTRSAQ